ncbi:MAG TPA: hypothetical protein VMT52_15755 [Planctomycetota bacterium]|nr:hypothetical protein [Planctomycetota bacterium]
MNGRLSRGPGLRVRLRRIRQAALFVTLLGVSIWGIDTWRADNKTFAWSRPLDVLVVVVVDPGVDARDDILRGFLHRFLTTTTALDINLAGVEQWFKSEHARHAGASMSLSRPVAITAAGPFTSAEAPPPPPPDGLGLLDRWRATRDFLGYFEALAAREKYSTAAYDSTVIVYFYDEEKTSAYARHHSVASRRTRMGIVFSPIGQRHFSRCASLVAHELCHTLGATDKYEGERSIFPDGFADPGRSPLYPQEKAEVMALGIPIAPDFEKSATTLRDCVVGRKTAEELGWVEE